MNTRKIITTLFFSAFLFVGVFTLPHYGINWDTINHLPRGQAFLHFFLTGRNDYSDLSEYVPYWQNPKSLSIDTDVPGNKISSRSFYQSDGTTAQWFLENEKGGHPPLSDIFSSIFNQVLFGKLKLINDIDAYRVYGIFLAASLVGLVFWWVSGRYGRFAGLIAAISLALYPLFFSEAHFNTEKDIPEAVFWSFMIFCFWKVFTTKKNKWVIATGLFFGFALGTKFNVIFSSLVLVPWILFYLGRKGLKENIGLLTKTAASFFVGFGIFFATWPYLWVDPIERIGKVIGFYRNIGFTQNRDPEFIILGFNSYPLQWIIYTTPLIILSLAIIGVLISLRRFKKEDDKLSLLFLLWLLVPIIRVTLPQSTVYGGIRQIMEYIPALAIFAGIGAGFLVENFKKRERKLFIMAVITLAFILHIERMINIHPNENVYFNELIGGLSGAKSRNLPSWGNSFGAVYRQGVIWINDNAVKDSKVALARELMPNIPTIWFRPDLSVSNGYRSGYTRQGEYVIGLTYQGTNSYSYFDSYLDKFLSPVYEVKVDDVAILKVWKNDEEHLKVNAQEKALSNVSLAKDESGFTLDIGEIKKISRLEIEYSEDSCGPLKSGLVLISPDGKNYEQQWGALPRQWRVASLGEQPNEGHFIEPFLGQEVRFIRLILFPVDTCLKNVKNFKVYTFK